MRLFRFILLLALCLSLTCCAARERTAAEILTELMDSCGALPAGEVYTVGAAEGEEGYLSAELAEALWGEDAKKCFAMLEDYAVYLSSFATPYEIAVFKCYSATDAIEIEQLCRARADIVSVSLRHTDFYSLCGNIRIVREGDTVVFLMTDIPEAAERIAKRLI